jgi:hypothetical protein
MKLFFAAASLLATLQLVAQTGVATVGVQPDVGTASFNNPATIGTTSFLQCMSSCTAVPSRIFITDESVQEWDGVVYVTVSIAPSSGQTVSVKYMTKNGSAKHPKDYDKAMGTIEFLPGEAFKKVPVTIVTDNIAEPQEEFFVELSHAINGIIADESGTVTINDIALRGGETVNILFSANAIPNPSAGEFLISVAGTSRAMIKVDVYDAIGRYVKGYSLVEGLSVRIGKEFGPGVYTVKVTQGTEVAVLRVVKL